MLVDFHTSIRVPSGWCSGYHVSFTSNCEHQSDKVPGSTPGLDIFERSKLESVLTKVRFFGIISVFCFLISLDKKGLNFYYKSR